MNEVYRHDGLDEKTLKIVVLLEGKDKFTDRMNDKGGATKYGISDMRDGIRDGMTDVDGDGKPDTYIKDLKESQALLIYKREYYNPYNVRYLKDEELILNLVDFGVTSGTSTSIKSLQKILGVVVDGNLGMKTANAANTYLGNLVGAFKERRKAFYKTIADRSVSNYLRSHPNASNKELLHNTQLENLQGWLNRVERLKF